MNVEIHWEITTQDDPIRIGPERCGIGSGPARSVGPSIQTFTPEDLLLILCIHGAKHRWERLVWLCDVAELARTPDALDWKEVIDTAQRLGSGRILFLGLLLASELLGVELPAPVVCAIERDPALIPLSDQVKGWISSANPIELDLGERERYFMRLRERPADKLRVAFRQAQSYLAPTSRDVEMLPVPSCLSWARYVYRPARLAWEYGVSPFSRFCKGIFES